MSGPVTAASPTSTAPRENRQHEKLVAAAQAFEAVFLRQMIGSMRQASLGEDVLGSSATGQFRDMSDAQLADQVADAGRFGIAAMLVSAFEKQGGVE